MIAIPLAWCEGTNGPITGETILAPLKRTFDPKKAREEFADYRKKWTGKLRGKFVLLRDPKIPAEQTKAQFQRYTDAELADIASRAGTRRQELCQTGRSGMAGRSG